MTQILPSYICDSWWEPQNPVTREPVTDPVTGDVVVELCTDGLDTAAAVENARTVGQRSLATMTIHERALVLKQLAQHLSTHRQELYDLSYRTGATLKDHFFDVDGGIGTLFTFSSKGRRELPNSNVIIDGAVEPLSKDGSFIGQHIYTRIPGVAVQINAFNFPVWGFLEKFAPAFIAGVPTIVKPAEQTSYVTEACVRLMLDSGLLPDGALQLVSGGGRDLLDHLDFRDLVAFTGSAATAHKLAEHPAIRERGARFTAETDSLNAAILAPDATPETPEFAAFIKTVMGEIMTKAGQKCTAIRRVLVPAELVDEVAQALVDKLGQRATLGAPEAEGTTVGALVSAQQRDAVDAAVRTLIEAGGQVVCGGPDAEVPEGAFVAPTVLTFADARTPAVHELEAFGPVTSILGYADIDDAIELARLGSGSLVATVCTHDPQTARRFAEGLAAYHGRLHFLDRDDAKTTTGHGSPMPQLVHGGPGRAGGGEELGGARAVRHFMQRTAVQGSPDMLTAITGVWHQGAQAHTVTRADVESGAGEHPFRKSLQSLHIGDQFVSELRRVTLDDILAFAESTGDKFYAHTDAEAAAANPFFPRQVAHGYLLVSWAAGLFVDAAPGPVLANYGLENLRFLTPVTWDDSIRVTLTCKQITPRVTDEYGEVAWDTVIHNQNDEIVATYDVLTLVAKEG